MEHLDWQCLGSEAQQDQDKFLLEWETSMKYHNISWKYHSSTRKWEKHPRKGIIKLFCSRYSVKKTYWMSLGSHQEDFYLDCVCVCLNSQNSYCCLWNNVECIVVDFPLLSAKLDVHCFFQWVGSEWNRDNLIKMQSYLLGNLSRS